MTIDDLADELARRVTHEDAPSIAALTSPRARAAAAEDLKRAVLAVAERAAADERERCALAADRRASRLSVRAESDPGATIPTVSRRQAVAAAVAELRAAAREMRAGTG